MNQLKINNYVTIEFSKPITSNENAYNYLSKTIQKKINILNVKKKINIVYNVDTILHKFKEYYNENTIILYSDINYEQYLKNVSKNIIESLYIPETTTINDIYESLLSYNVNNIIIFDPVLSTLANSIQLKLPHLNIMSYSEYISNHIVQLVKNQLENELPDLIPLDDQNDLTDSDMPDLITDYDNVPYSSSNDVLTYSYDYTKHYNSTDDEKKNNLENVYQLSKCEESDSHQYDNVTSDSEQLNSKQSDSEQSDSEQSDSEQSNSESSNNESSDSEQSNSESSDSKPLNDTFSVSNYLNVTNQYVNVIVTNTILTSFAFVYVLLLGYNFNPLSVITCLAYGLLGLFVLNNVYFDGTYNYLMVWVNELYPYLFVLLVGLYKYLYFQNYMYSLVYYSLMRLLYNKLNKNYNSSKLTCMHLLYSLLAILYDFDNQIMIVSFCFYSYGLLF
jgi:hypothetical protein